MVSNRIDRGKVEFYLEAAQGRALKQLPFTAGFPADGQTASSKVRVSEVLALKVSGCHVRANIYSNPRAAIYLVNY